MKPLFDRRTAHGCAIGLGIFSIGLGLLELLFTRPLAKSIGMKGDEGLLRLYGAREIATGIGILASRDRAPWIWARVAGDALDLATLAARAPNARKTVGLSVAAGAVAGVALLDAVTASSLDAARPRLAAPARDYSARSGFPGGVQNARGAARDFEVPRDMRMMPAWSPGPVH